MLVNPGYTLGFRPPSLAGQWQEPWFVPNVDLVPPRTGCQLVPGG